MKKTFLLRLQFLLCVVMLVHHFFIHTDYQNSMFRKVAQQNLQTVEWEDDDWPEDSFFTHLKHCLKVLRNPQPFQKRKCAFDLIGPIHNQKYPTIHRLVDPTTCLDLELLRGKDTDSPYLGSIINRTTTQIGYATFLTMLSLFSTNDIAELTKRQAIVRQFLNDPTLFSQCEQIYKQLSSHENYIISFWHKRDPLRQALDRNYYNVPKLGCLNSSVAALELKNVLGHYQRATFAGASFLASIVSTTYGLNYFFNARQPALFNRLRERLGGNGGEFGPVLSLLSLLSNSNLFQRGIALTGGICCGLALKEQLLWMRDMSFLDYCIQVKLMHVACYIEHAKKLANLLHSYPQLKNTIPGADELIRIAQQPQTVSAQLHELLQLLSTRTFRGKPSIFSLQGRVARAYKLMYEVKDQLAPMFEAIGYIDAYCSVSTLCKEFEHQRVTYTFAEYQERAIPGIELKDFWNPFISADKVIPNSVSLGLQHGKRNMILTGPNAGGKSTVIKSITISLILAQTFGIVPARDACITPFARIGTHLNITDDIASGNSLFKSEVNRAQDLISMVEKIEKEEHAFIIMDELFNGTTPAEGEAAAFSFANYLGAKPNVICVIATHFELLANLEKETQNFMNYKVLIERGEDNQIKYTFKLVPGISDQHIALDILRSEGFPSTILDPATAMLIAK